MQPIHFSYLLKLVEGKKPRINGLFMLGTDPKIPYDLMKLYPTLDIALLIDRANEVPERVFEMFDEFENYEDETGLHVRSVILPYSIGKFRERFMPIQDKFDFVFIGEMINPHSEKEDYHQLLDGMLNDDAVICSLYATQMKDIVKIDPAPAWYYIK